MRLRARGYQVSADAVDRVLNHHNATTAVLMRIEARQALWYAPDVAMDTIAEEICAAIQYGFEDQPNTGRNQAPATGGGDRHTPEVRVVASESYNSDEFERAPVAGMRAQRREALLIDRFERFLGGIPREFGRLRITVPGEGIQLVTDTFDISSRVLYEAKASSDRMTVRLGIGQLFDYLRFVPGARGALLLPEDPGNDLFALITRCRLGVVWPQGASWANFDQLHGRLDLPAE